MTVPIILIIILSVSQAIVVFLAIRLAKRAFMKEKEEDERSRVILEGLPIACFLLDSKYIAFECNHTAVKLFAHKSYSQHIDDVEIQGVDLDCCDGCIPCDKKFVRGCAVRRYLIKNLAMLIFGNNDSDGCYEWIKEKCLTANREGINRFEHEHQNLHGELVPSSVTIVPIIFNQQECFSVYIQDLRATKKMLDEIQLRQIAEEENLAKTRFLARMSHEIRTPLNAVLGTTQLELRKNTHPPDTAKAFLRIQNSSTMLLSIINDILDISKVEAGKFAVEADLFEPEQFISEVLQINHVNIENRNITFSLHVDRNLPKYQIGDVLRLKQIVNNLLSNAFKYTKEGSVSFSVSAEQIIGYSGAIFIYEVKDSGMGMNKDQVDNLFIEFERFGSTENQSIEGTGLGMPIVQQLVRMMDGSIEVDSEPGIGTTITVKIPQEILGFDSIGEDAAKELESLNILQKDLHKKQANDIVAMPYGRVLVVDDVETNLDIMDGILSMYGIEAELSPSGVDALERVSGGKAYDVIFMDHMMPELDGIETTRRLREDGYKGAIVALTANALVSNKENFMQSGFNEFLAKPIDIDELSKCLMQFVHRRDNGEQVSN